MANRVRPHRHVREPALQLPDIDPTRMAELLESCRVHAASVAELAGVTSKALSECYEYEVNEPHLGQCCELVRQVLGQTQAALVTQGVASEAEPRMHAEEVYKCFDLQRQSLTRAMHVVRAMAEILGTLHPNHHEHVLLALYDLESGIGTLIDGIARVTPVTSRPIGQSRVSVNSKVVWSTD